MLGDDEYYNITIEVGKSKNISFTYDRHSPFL